MARETDANFQSGFSGTDAQMAWDDLRASPAFPAIVGGLAGALVGGAMMVLFGRKRGPQKGLPAAYDEEGNPMKVVYLPPPKSPMILGFAPGDLLTLGTIGLSLVRQVQDAGRIKQAKQTAEEAKYMTMQEPSPSPETLHRAKKVARART